MTEFRACTSSVMYLEQVVVQYIGIISKYNSYIQITLRSLKFTYVEVQRPSILQYLLYKRNEHITTIHFTSSIDIDIF